MFVILEESVLCCNLTNFLLGSNNSVMSALGWHGVGWAGLGCRSNDHFAEINQSLIFGDHGTNGGTLGTLTPSHVAAAHQAWPGDTLDLCWKQIDE